MRKMYLDNVEKWQNNTIKWDKLINKDVNFIYDDIKGIMKIINYDNKTHMLDIKYLNNDIQKIHTSSFKNYQLGKFLNVRTKNFKIEIGQKFQDDKRDLIVIDRKYIQEERIGKSEKVSIENRKYYKYKCNKCGFDCGKHYRNGKYQKEHWIIESDLLHSYGCACCGNKITVPEINDIPTTAPELVKYFQGEYEEAKLYTKLSGQKIKVKCPDCGRIKNKTVIISNLYKKHSIGCSCGDKYSYPNKFCHSLLEQLNIKFETEYSPDWIKPKRYDFYFELNGNKYIIEMDGGLGHGKKVHSKSNLTKEDSKQIDDYKDKLANEHNIQVIRIDCKKSELEYIKNKILNNQLNDLFDFSKINWNKCKEFALSNLVKKACEYKRDNPDMTTMDIAKILNISKTTVRRYLKKGTELGWCNYDPKEEFNKTLFKKGENKKTTKN